MNKLYIILGLSVLFMFGVIWKGNKERMGREQEYQRQSILHMQKMARLEIERQENEAREASEKARKAEQRRIENENARLESEKIEHEMRMKEYSETEYPNSYYEEELHRHIFE